MDLKTATGRIKSFQSDYPNGKVRSTYIDSPKGYIFKAEIYDDEKFLCEAHAMEEVGSTTFCKDFETCETKAISRALAMIGYNDGAIATKDDIHKADVRKKKSSIVNSVAKPTKAGLEAAPRGLEGARTVSLILKKNKAKKSLKTLARELDYKTVEEMCKNMKVDDILTYK